MKVCERKMVDAMLNYKSVKCCANTHTTVVGDKVYVYLFGNLIAWCEDVTLYISDSGWKSSTTKSRLNAILDTFKQPRLSQSKFEWYRKDLKWEGFAYIYLDHERFSDSYPVEGDEYYSGTGELINDSSYERYLNQ